MVKVRDILPLIQWNDAQIIKDQDEEICLLRNDFMVGSLSEEILNMTVTGIETMKILRIPSSFMLRMRRIKFMHFTVIQIIIMFLIGYVCLYALIDRVMKCIEHCATARAYGRFREAGATMKMDDVAAGIAKSKEEKRNVEKRLD